MKLFQLIGSILFISIFLWFGKTMIDYLIPDVDEGSLILLNRRRPHDLDFDRDNHHHEIEKPNFLTLKIEKLTEKSPTVDEITFQEFLKGIPSDDKRILDFVRKNFLIPPSKLPYNLSNPHSGSTDRGQVPIIKEILGNIKSGFFIESGAFDGEWTSNTLYLEKDFGWTGLLVEPQPFVIDTLLSKHRKSWISPVCLSPNAYPSQLNFIYAEGMGVSGKIGDLSEIKIEERSKWKSLPIQCLPLGTILNTLGVKTVDYWSLDVEGVEMSVLYNFPFDQILVKSMSIEHQFIAEKESLKTFMFSKGFDFVKVIERDYIFAHKSLNFLKRKAYGSFKNEWSGECINSFSQTLDNGLFNMGTYECHTKPVHQQTFTLTSKNVMRFFEGGCWASNDEFLSVSRSFETTLKKLTLKKNFEIFCLHRCFEENFDKVDQWTYDENPGGSKKLINLKTKKCLTSLEGSQLRLQNCTENSSNQKWTLIEYDL